MAGGSGVTASLPWLVYLAVKMRSAAHNETPLHENSCKTRSIHLIWSIRSVHWIRWAERELSEALHEVAKANTSFPDPMKRVDESHGSNRPNCRLRISIFVTAGNTNEADLKITGRNLLLSAGVSMNNEHAQVGVFCGRPDYMNAIPEMMEAKRNIVLGT